MVAKDVFHAHMLRPAGRHKAKGGEHIWRHTLLAQAFLGLGQRVVFSAADVLPRLPTSRRPQLELGRWGECSAASSVS